MYVLFWLYQKNVWPMSCMCLGGSCFSNVLDSAEEFVASLTIAFFVVVACDSTPDVVFPIYGYL